jgi:hypothetical protein
VLVVVLVLVAVVAVVVMVVSRVCESEATSKRAGDPFFDCRSRSFLSLNFFVR